jgi:hypothetical protein
MKAWHIVNSDYTLNYDLAGTKVYPGLELFYEGELELCEKGLHASERLVDALSYGNSGVICRVEVGEDYLEGSDKLVSSYRKVLAVADCTSILQQFAIETAESVLPIYEKEYPNDNRPRAAIEAVKAYLAGEISQAELESAVDAARAAVDAAADAADAAAFDAARAADAYAARATYAAYAARATYAAADAADAAAFDAARAADAYSELNDQLEQQVLECLGVD